MLDTIRFHYFSDIHIKGKIHLKNKNWNYIKIRKNFRNKFGEVDFHDHKLTHSKYDIRIGLHGTRVKWVECSLPKVLFEVGYRGKLHNGKLLKTQEEIDSAFDKLHKILYEVIDKKYDVTNYYFIRLDICWHFDVNVESYLNYYKKQIHPEIRKQPVEISKTCIKFKGDEMDILMYHKPKELKIDGINFLKVEVSFTDKKLRRLFCNENESQVKRPLDIIKLYTAYREVLIRFNPIITDTKAWDIYKLLAYLETKELKYKEDDYELEFRDLFLTGKRAPKSQNWRIWRKKIESHKKKLEKVNVVKWADLLPVDKLPDNPPEIDF